MESPILHKSLHKVAIGQTIRFDVEFTPCSSSEEYLSSPPSGIWLRVRNMEPIALRAAYVAGPYSLYVDCRPQEFDVSKRSFVTADQPVFEPQLHPGSTFSAELSCHTFKPSYRWIVDVSSQMLFSLSQVINFEFILSTEKDPKSSLNATPSPHLSVNILDTLDIWNLPIPDQTRPIHLVILTHGLHSNVSADMLFLKERIDSSSANVVVKGFFGNVCKTERGIKYLGSRVAEFVIDLLKSESLARATKISFIGHSLGGLVQTFAIAYLETNYPWVFRALQPVNFITLASPMLGVIHENPAYVKIALQAGIAGRTGHDLGLQITEKDGKPLLLLLPSGPTHRILKRFIRRTVYANAFNDGIVPLRTSALLYLDYRGLASVLGPNSSKLGDEEISVEENVHSAKIPRDLPNSSEISDSRDSSTSAFSAMLSYFMPQKQSAPQSDFEVTNSASRPVSTDDSSRRSSKPSVLESATSLLLPPLPPLKYITNPESRENVIIHDKIYTEEDIPETDAKKSATTSSDKVMEKSGMMYKLSLKGDEIKQLLLGKLSEKLEEEIAREYHKKMSWRKVLVHLQPDAHNNIVVRRRFANAFGWPVIEHLVSNHFSTSDSTDVMPSKDDNLDISVEGAELTRILSVEAIQKENAELDKESINSSEHSWIHSGEKGEAFDGPAGSFSALSERVLKLKQDWDTNGIRVFQGKDVTEPMESMKAQSQVMEDFL